MAGAADVQDHDKDTMPGPSHVQEHERDKMPGTSNVQEHVGDSMSGPLNVREHVRWMDSYVPVFGVRGDNIHVIYEPAEFYETLKEQAGAARRRIVLASLYLGTGRLEKDLVHTIHDSVRRCSNQTHPLKVDVLLDFTRGSRGEDNSRTMLLPLLKEFDKHVQVSLYHSPDLRGMLKWILPERWNEVVGLNHLKVYLFDDNLIMSGANLSESYFTNRQDRYILLRDCPELADFFHNLVTSVSDVSFRLQTDDTVELAPGLQNHPFQDSDGGTKYRAEARDRLHAFIPATSNGSSPPADSSNDSFSGESPTSSSASSSDIDTWVYPLIQLPPFNITVDETVTGQYFRNAAKDSTIHLGSGYFNLTEDYMDIILTDSFARFQILAAAPQANGFFNGAGVSGYIPDAYTHIARHFMERVNLHDQEERISLHEYTRTGWTFHGKGLWHYLPRHSLPFLTFVGSSNFGYRSVFRDLEAQLVVATQNRRLQGALHEEQRRLFARASPTSLDALRQPDRGVPWWVTYVTTIIRKFF